MNTKFYTDMILWSLIFMITFLTIFTLLNIKSSVERATEKQTSATQHIYTDNMKDCLERGGEYLLSIKSTSSINIESCQLENNIDYTK